MRVSNLLACSLLQAASITASPHDTRGNKDVVPSKRPNYSISPKHPSSPFPVSPKRTKTCIVEACGNGGDDSANILKAIKDCNNGGHVVFPKKDKFTIGTALNLTFLEHIDLGEPISVSKKQNVCTDVRYQTSKVRFNSQTTRITGRRMHSTRPSKMPPRSSSWVVMMSMSMVVAPLMAMVRCGTIFTQRTSTSCVRFCSVSLAFRAGALKT